MEWGITTIRMSAITLPLVYNYFYCVVTGNHSTNQRGGRNVNAINRTLSGWTCTLGAGNSDFYNYWDEDTHWLTVGS